MQYEKNDTEVSRQGGGHIAVQRTASDGYAHFSISAGVNEKKSFLYGLYGAKGNSGNCCGSANGTTYSFWGWVDVETFLRLWGLAPEQVQAFRILLNPDKNCSFRVTANTGTVYIGTVSAQDGWVAVDYADIVARGYRDFKLDCVDADDFVSFGSKVKAELYTTTHGWLTIASFAPFGMFLTCYEPPAEEGLRYGMSSGVQYFTWGKVDAQKFCEEYGILPDALEDITFTFRGASGQTYDVWANNGLYKIGTYTAEGGKYAVSLSEIWAAGFDDFSITSFNEYGFFGDTYTIDVAYDPEKMLQTDLSYGSDENQKFDISFPPAGAPVPADGYPVVVTIHGGNWSEYFAADGTKIGATDKDYYDYMTELVLGQKCVHVNMEYRRMRCVEGSVGYQNNFIHCADMLDDIGALLDHLQTIYAGRAFLNMNKVALMGHSAGGHLALLYAYSRGDGRVKSVISEAGPVVLDGENQIYSEWWGIFSQLANVSSSSVYFQTALQNISPIHFANAGSIKTLLLYGAGINVSGFEGDGLVPVDPARCLKDKIGTNCDLVELDGQDHNMFKSMVEYKVSPNYDAWLAAWEEAISAFKGE